MKRTLQLAIPLALLLVIGAFYLWLRRPGESRAPIGDGGSGAPTEAAEPPPDTGTPPPLPVRPGGGAIRVTVAGGTGPLAGARVRIAREPTHESFEKTTNSSGDCLFDGLRPGEWFVGARLRGCVPVSTGLRVEEGRTTETVLQLIEGGRVQGTVSGADGLPIAGATVTVLDPERRSVLDPALSSRTDERGQYLVEGIPLRSVGLNARAPRYRPVERHGIAFSRPGETQVHDFLLEVGSTVSGRVINESGAPIAGATVTAGNEHAAAVQTDAEGRFTVSGLGDGPAGLSAGAPGYGTAYLRNIPPNTQGIEFRLYRGGRLEGRLNLPLESFSVLLYRYEPDLGTDLRVDARTFRGVEFSMPDVAPGVYDLTVEAPGYEAVSRVKIVVNPGETVGGIAIEMRAKP